MEGFKAGEVVRAAGLGSFDTLDYWATTGFLTPSVPVPKGKRRLYSFSDVVAARAAGALRERGVSLPTLRKVVEKLQELEDSEAHPLARVRLVVSDKDVLVARDRDTLMSLLEKPGQLVLRMVIELEPLVRGVRTALAAHPRREKRRAATVALATVSKGHRGKPRRSRASA